MLTSLRADVFFLTFFNSAVVLKWNGQVMEPADMLYLHGKDPLVSEPNRYIITGDSGQVKIR